jgi:predicted peptidase
MRLRLLFLWLVVSVCSYGQISIIGVSGRNKKTVAPTEVVLSAPSFVSGGNYQTGREYYIYKPRGYDQASAGSLPLMVFFGGYGMRTWANRVNEGEGLYYYLNNGSWDDLTYDHIVVVCEYTVGDVDPNTGHFDDILTELTAEGVKYDPDRISYTGLSGGAIGAYNVIRSVAASWN